MENNVEQTPVIDYDKIFFEFQYSLKMNGIGIFVRDFNILGYNNKFRESLEARELMDALMGDGYFTGIIPSYLKKLSVNGLWEAYEDKKMYTIPHKIRKRPTKFVFEITKKVANTDQREVILSAEYDAKYIQKDAMLDIDMRSEIKNITDTIRRYATIKDLTFTAHDTELTRNNRLSRKLVNLIVDANS